MKTELGRCDVCNTGKMVYRSRETETNVCAGCYARLERAGIERMLTIIGEAAAMRW